MIYFVILGLGLLGLWIIEKRERKQHDAARFRKRAVEHELRTVMDTHPVLRGVFNPPKSDGTKILHRQR